MQQQKHIHCLTRSDHGNPGHSHTPAPHSQQYLSFVSTLYKQPESRTSKQISQIIEYVQHNDGLRQLQHRTSFKFMKNILLRYAQILCIDKGRVLVQEGDKIQKIFVVMAGGVVSKGGNQGRDQYYSEIQRLGIIADQFAKEHSKMIRNRSKYAESQPQSHLSRPQPIIDQSFTPVLVIGFQDRSLGTRYITTAVTTDRSQILQISIQGFLLALAQVVHQKVKALYDLLHNYSCFIGLEKDIIQKFIMALAQKRRKRGMYIYRQGEPVKSIYLLTQGQIKLTKQSNLFVQDPNNLYANRLNLILQNPKQSHSQSHPHRHPQFPSNPPSQSPSPQKSLPKYHQKQQSQLKQSSILPYADLSLMYNFQPKKKTLEISKVHALCIFGGEEFIENKKRETNAICDSLEVVYYEMPVGKIQDIFGKQYQGFLRAVGEEARERVLHRQNYYANSIHFENKANLDYFYYQGQTQKKSPPKFRISKLNSKLQQLPKSLQQKSHIAPHYTAFNFNKLSKSPGESPQRLKLSQPLSSQTHPIFNTISVTNPNPETHILPRNGRESQQHGKGHGVGNKYQQARESDDDEIQFAKPNDEEMKIMNITHTWKIIKNKVDAEVVKSHKLSSKRYTIDVNQPLIDNSFLVNLDKEKRRLQKRIRREKIMLGKSRMSALQKRQPIQF